MALEVNIIVAVGKQWVYKEINNTTYQTPVYPIGKNGTIPWHCKEDLQWFKEVTMGYPVIMGRKTFESIGKVLPGRKNIVITSQLIPVVNDNLIYVKNVEEAIEIAGKLSEKAFIIGGGSVYKYVIENDLVDNIYIDELDVEINDADTFFPNFKNSNWKQVGRRIEIARDFAYASIYEKERGRKNNELDNQYLKLGEKILKEGVKKVSRAGTTYSLFGEQLRFNLKKGLPMLTTKKMFSKGIIHELIWFIKGDTNIKYLIDNNVHIWDDDSYRYYIELTKEWRGPSGLEKICDKETFLEKVQLGEVSESILNRDKSPYKYGDLGPVYGNQWRNWNGIDQLKDIIEKLKNNPDDRRLILSAWNISDIPNMALPPCHYCCQFYTKEMSHNERKTWFIQNIRNTELDIVTDKYMDEANVPKRKLSCMWMQRSVDFPLGWGFNVFSYALFTHMIAQCVNMDVDELIFNGGDVHIYENQIPAFEEQLKRNPYKYALPKLELNPNIKNIEDFKYEDIKIVGYQSYPTIKFPLSVGL